jgi:hypothetical protein
LHIFLDWMGAAGGTLMAREAYIRSGGRGAPKLIMDALAVLVIGPGVIVIAWHVLGFAFGLLGEFLPI